MSKIKEPWKISAEDRKKHNVEFKKLSPQSTPISGNQAKAFLLKSGLPPAVLGQIWELADIDKDGKMSELEFSIAVHLIQLKLEKHDLPRILPASMKVDPLKAAASAAAPPAGAQPTALIGSAVSQPAKPAAPLTTTNSTAMSGTGVGQGGFPARPTPVQPMMGTNTAVMGTTSSLSSLSSLSSSAAFPTSFGAQPSPFMTSTLPMSSSHNAANPMGLNGHATLPFGGTAAPMATGFGTAAPKPAEPPKPVQNGSSKDLSVPPSTKRKYTQVFNTLDKSRKGFLSGMEARGVLTKSGLTHTVLAKIWQLSDIDNDGKLMTEEFVLAMHLVDLVKSGVTLPAKLPPELVPPAYKKLVEGAAKGSASGSGSRSNKSSSAVGMPPPTAPATQPTANSTTATTPKSDSFGDLLGGLTMPIGPTLSSPGGAAPASGGAPPLSLGGAMGGAPPGGAMGMAGVPPVMGGTGSSGVMAAGVSGGGMAPTLVSPPGGGLGIASAPIASTVGTAVTSPTAGPGSVTSPTESEDGTSSAAADLDSSVTFEDKRRENFNKGQAELEKRREMLREQQKREQEERLAAERAEQEKREKIRLEQERKKQEELERQREKQRQIEMEKEEQRRKALEQREAARRELERSRQLEWERQRREKLISEKQKHQDQVEALEAQVSKYRLELETLDSKKTELSDKITAARQGVTDITSSINAMRTLRDVKLSDIDQCNKDIQEWTYKFNAAQRERLQNDAQLQLQANSAGDTFRTAKKTEDARKQSISKLKAQLEQLENDMSSRQATQQDMQANYETISATLNDQQSAVDKLKADMTSKQNEWNHMKLSQQRLPSVSSVASEQGRYDEAMSGTPGGSVSSAPGGSSAAPAATPGVKPGYQLYTALYQFDARNHDEISLTPGINVWVKDDQTGVEQDWLSAVLDNGAEGIFPEAYAERVSAADDTNATGTTQRYSNEPFTNDSITSPTGSVASSTAFTAVPASGSSGPSPVTGKGTMVEDGIKAQALYPWMAKKDNHLTFSKGDIILLKEQTDMWASGELNGKVGWFPKTYVKILGSQTQLDGGLVGQGSIDQGVGSVDNTSAGDGVASANGVSATAGAGGASGQGEYYIASYTYSSNEAGDLSFNEGDTILVTEKNGLWYTGTLGDQSGIFPANYVAPLDGGTDQQPVTSPTAATAMDAPAITTSPATTTQQPPAESMDPTMSTSSTGFQQAYNDSVPDSAYTDYSTAEYSTAEYSAMEYSAPTTTTTEYSTAAATQEYAADTGGGDGGDGGLYENLDNITAEINAASNQALSPSPQPDSAAAKKPEIATVIAAYTATGNNQLDLVKGQLIQVRKRSESGWWEGELQARGQKRKIGWFPANYVKVLGGGSSARSTPDFSRAKSPNKSATPTPTAQAAGATDVDDTRNATPQPSADIAGAAATAATIPATASGSDAMQHTEAVEQVVAQFAYVSQMDDELSFDKGSIITVLAHNDNEWWKGELGGTVGVFPSNYVVPIHEAPPELLQASQSFDSLGSVTDLAGAEYKRQIAIMELIDTEETFMSDMSIVLDVFHKPLKAEKVLTDEELNRIFVNWKELMVANNKLLKALRVRKKMVGENQPIHMIGDILCENLPHMTPYIRFCSCQLNAASLIQHKTETSPKFKDVCQKCCRDPRTKGLPMSSFLLKPMQRITKYPLMLQKILKYTPEDHSDYQNMTDALSRANEICAQVNEGVREKENSDKLEWIQAHVSCDSLPEKVTYNSVTNCLGPRKFLYHGTLVKAKSGKELVGFLFNDFLLLAVPSKTQAAQQVFKKDMKSVSFKMYRAPIFLNEVMVVKKNNESESDPGLFHVNHIDRVYSFKAPTKNEKEMWMKHLDDSSRIFLETERQKREKVHAARSHSFGVGRLMVIIAEGHNLTASDDNGKSDPYCEVSMGVQENKTKVINNTLNPKWNASMQFIIRDPREDVLCITVYDRDLFTPNDFLGRTEVRVYDIQQESSNKKGPITKKLQLHEVESGEVTVKLDLQLYET